MPNTSNTDNNLKYVGKGGMATLTKGRGSEVKERSGRFFRWCSLLVLSDRWGKVTNLSCAGWKDVKIWAVKQQYKLAVIVVIILNYSRSTRLEAIAHGSSGSDKTYSVWSTEYEGREYYGRTTSCPEWNGLEFSVSAVKQGETTPYSVLHTLVLDWAG